MAGPDSLEWVLVCGGFHEQGGMDRANAAVAEYLSDRGACVHLIGHEVAAALRVRNGVRAHVVPRTAGSVLAGELALGRRVSSVVRDLRRQGRPAVVVANGGNILDADVNWVHSVHAAWPTADAGAPPWFKVKNRGVRWWYRRRERTAIRAARLVIANSNRTRNDVVTLLGVAPERVHTVYLGSADDWRVPSLEKRQQARRHWGSGDVSRPLVAFVGSLGHDVNKGIDTLLSAWNRLRAGGAWDADLVVAGSGSADRWKRTARANGDVRFVGFLGRVGDLLDAADLLVSPVRYEAYGLAMHEAICRGVPVLTSANAGIAERFGTGLTDLLLQRADDADELASKLIAWRARPAAWVHRFAQVRRELSADSFRAMASRIAELVILNARGSAAT